MRMSSVTEAPERARRQRHPGRKSKTARDIEARIFVDGDRHRRQGLRNADVRGRKRGSDHGLIAGFSRALRIAKLLEVYSRENIREICQRVLQQRIEERIGKIGPEPDPRPDTVKRPRWCSAGGHGDDWLPVQLRCRLVFLQRQRGCGDLKVLGVQALGVKENSAMTFGKPMTSRPLIMDQELSTKIKGKHSSGSGIGNNKPKNETNLHT